MKLLLHDVNQFTALVYILGNVIQFQIVYEHNTLCRMHKYLPHNYIRTAHTCSNTITIHIPYPGDLKRDESVSRQRDNLVASVWRDRKLVYLMSTNSHPEGNTTVQRRERDGSVQQIPCPPSVVEYNKFMGGVDKADQLRNGSVARHGNSTAMCFGFCSIVVSSTPSS